jgi:DNA-binding SARP family transcriptional activator
VKLLALVPSHRLHCEQAIDLLWPDSDRRAASNNQRQALHVAPKILASDREMASLYLAQQEGVLLLWPEGPRCG